MHVDHSRQHCSLGIRRVKREAQHKLINTRFQQLRRENELVAKVLTHDAASDPTGSAAVRWDDPGLDVLSVHCYRIRHVRVFLSGQSRPLVVPVGRLRASEVDCEGRLLRSGQLRVGEIELNRPVIDIVVDRLRAETIARWSQ